MILFVMKFTNTLNRYGLLAKLFHWITFLALIVQIPFGFYLVSLEFSGRRIDLETIHMLIGISIFYLVLFRLIWKLINPPPKPWRVFFKGQNDLIRYRLKNTNILNKNYLRNLFNIDTKKKIIFFASDPLKEESQRYLTEQFLINYFSNNKEFILIIKTHNQDNGNEKNINVLI